MVQGVSGAHTTEGSVAVTTSRAEATQLKPEVGTVQAAKSPAGDTIRLSVAAQVRHLKQQGLPASQIASNLGISAKDVAGYLGSAVKAPVPVASAAVQAPEEGSVAHAAAPPAAAAAPVSAKG